MIGLARQGWTTRSWPKCNLWANAEIFELEERWGWRTRPPRWMRILWALPDWWSGWKTLGPERKGGPFWDPRWGKTARPMCEALKGETLLLEEFSITNQINKKWVRGLRSLNASVLSATSKHFIKFIVLASNATLHAIRDLLKKGCWRFTHTFFAARLTGLVACAWALPFWATTLSLCARTLPSFARPLLWWARTLPLCFSTLSWCPTAFPLRASFLSILPRDLFLRSREPRLPSRDLSWAVTDLRLCSRFLSSLCRWWSLCSRVLSSSLREWCFCSRCLSWLSRVFSSLWSEPRMFRSPPSKARTSNSSAYSRREGWPALAL